LQNLQVCRCVLTRACLVRIATTIFELMPALLKQVSSSFHTRSAYKKPCL
jgi:hypothetical protein